MATIHKSISWKSALDPQIQVDSGPKTHVAIIIIINNMTSVRLGPCLGRSWTSLLGMALLLLQVAPLHAFAGLGLLATPAAPSDRRAMVLGAQLASNNDNEEQDVFPVAANDAAQARLDDIRARVAAASQERTSNMTTAASLPSRKQRRQAQKQKRRDEKVQKQRQTTPMATGPTDPATLPLSQSENATRIPASASMAVAQGDASTDGTRNELPCDNPSPVEEETPLESAPRVVPRKMAIALEKSLFEDSRVWDDNNIRPVTTTAVSIGVPTFVQPTHGNPQGSVQFPRRISPINHDGIRVVGKSPKSLVIPMEAAFAQDVGAAETSEKHFNVGPRRTPRPHDTIATRPRDNIPHDTSADTMDSASPSLYDPIIPMEAAFFNEIGVSERVEKHYSVPPPQQSPLRRSTSSIVNRRAALKSDSRVQQPDGLGMQQESERGLTSYTAVAERDSNHYKSSDKAVSSHARPRRISEHFDSVTKRVQKPPVGMNTGTMLSQKSKALEPLASTTASLVRPERNEPVQQPPTTMTTRQKRQSDHPPGNSQGERTHRVRMPKNDPQNRLKYEAAAALVVPMEAAFDLEPTASETAEKHLTIPRTLPKQRISVPNDEPSKMPSRRTASISRTRQSGNQQEEQQSPPSGVESRKSRNKDRQGLLRDVTNQGLFEEAALYRQKPMEVAFEEDIHLSETVVKHYTYPRYDEKKPSRTSFDKQKGTEKETASSSEKTQPSIKDAPRIHSSISKSKRAALSGETETTEDDALAPIRNRLPMEVEFDRDSPVAESVEKHYTYPRSHDGPRSTFGSLKNISRNPGSRSNPSEPPQHQPREASQRQSSQYPAVIPMEVAFDIAPWVAESSDKHFTIPREPRP
uniref:Uncharacterized protein n=1 Tax=Entomoneis paludosa TaxID=265537 RepID=A0A7S2YFH3_9STRA|mmetsp:Transcript_30960/g.64626  ORF Transcript_30960/g.64626 Transcript_30960/m.64626 type:complete len:865 (+) Transcript_30960:52-2646(+)